MAYVAVNCPNCGGSIQIDNTLDSGHCSYCGSLIDFREAVERLNIIHEVDSTEENFIKLIHKEITSDRNHLPEFRSLLYRAIEQHPNSEYLKNLYASEVWKARVIDGALVRFPTELTKITLPSCITTIKAHAFDSAQRMIYITIPKSVVCIEDKAFKYNSVLTINAYINSYAVKYALTNPMDLTLLDGGDYEQAKIREIKSEHKKIVNHINSVHKKIQIVMDKKRNFSVFPLILITCVIIWFVIFIAIFSSPDDKAVKLMILLPVDFAVVMGSILINKQKEKKRNTALMEQISAYNSICNEFLQTLGLVNFIYLAGSSYAEETDYDEEYKRVVAVKEKIKGIHLYQFFN